MYPPPAATPPTSPAPTNVAAAAATPPALPPPPAPAPHARPSACLALACPRLATSDIDDWLPPPNACTVPPVDAPLRGAPCLGRFCTPPTAQPVTNGSCQRLVGLQRECHTSSAGRGWGWRGMRAKRGGGKNRRLFGAGGERRMHAGAAAVARTARGLVGWFVQRA